MPSEQSDEQLEAMIAKFNPAPGSVLDGRTPLEYLRDLCANSESWPKKCAQVQVEQPPATRRAVVVRGNLAKGRRPHINFHGVKYTSDNLRNAFNLIGKRITIEIMEDIRTVRAYSESGADLGPLLAAPPWHLAPHTVEMRQAIQAHIRQMKRDRFKGGDPVLAYMDYLEEQVRTGKVIPSQYLETRRLLTIPSSEPHASADQGNSPGAQPEQPDRKTDNLT